MSCGAVDGCSVEFSEEFEQRRFIITGGPGVGKTSVVRHYEDNGLFVIHEAATDLIRDMLSHQIVQPWNQEGFNRRVIDLQLQRQAEAQAKKTALVFFDRSPIDVLTYAVLQKDKEHSHITEMVEAVISRGFYHKKVFLIENLGRCEKTEVRAESVEEALKIEKYIEDHYRKFGFEIIRVPPAPIEERARMILEHLRGELPSELYLSNILRNFPGNISAASA